MMYSVVILAGGKGTRLGELAANRPKALVPVAGKPFIQHQLQLLRLNDIRHVVVCIGHLGYQIKDYLKNTRDPVIDFCDDGKTPLGTAGALRKALPLLDDNFFVLYGDSYLPCDYAAIQSAFAAAREPALMTVCRVPTRPNVRYDNGYVVQYNKDQPEPDMEHKDYGLSVWRKDAMQLTAADDLSDVYCRLANNGQLAGYEWPEIYHTVGTPAGVAATEEFIKSSRSR